jgi:Protein of unknown function (DUF3618)
LDSSGDRTAPADRVTEIRAGIEAARARVVGTVNALRLKADVPARLGDAVGTAASTFTAHVIDRMTASEGDGWTPDQASGGERGAAPGPPVGLSSVQEEMMSERENQGGDGEIAVCHVCGKKYASQELLSQHLMEEHADDD